MEAILKSIFDLEEQYIESFKEHGIDEEAFILLDDDTIQTLIPKVGPRLKFKHKYKEYLASHNQIEQYIEDIPDDSYTFSPGSELTSILESHTSENIVTGKRKTPEPDDDEEYDAMHIHSNKKKRELLFPQGLESFLKSSVDGRFVLSFKNNLSYKNNLPRKKLCKEIINRFIQVEHPDNIPRNIWMFHEAAQEIVELFPQESKEIYFIPYKKKTESSPKKSPKGRLWSRFHNVKNLLKISEGCREIKTSTPNPTSLPAEDDIANFNVLRTIVEPKTRVYELWEQTYHYRKQFFKGLTIEEIINNVPALKTEFGSELINHDFNEKYPEQIDHIYLKWPKLTDALLKEATQRKVCAVENSTDVELAIVAILTLPYLVPPVTLRRSKGFNWRPSRTEIQESFFFQVDDIAEVPKILRQRQEKLAWAKSTLQPYGIIVGPLNLPKEFRVCIGEVTYRFDSFLRAFEILYKGFHALNIKYPIESQHLWCFIEAIVFDRKVKNSSAASLIADIKHHLL